MVNRNDVLTAVFFSVIILGSGFGANVALAETQTGGNTSTTDLTSPPDIAISDAVINDTTNSTIDVAYALPDGTDPSAYTLTVEGVHQQYQKSNLTQSGTVSLEIPAGTIGGGSHYFTAKLEDGSGYPPEATDTATVQTTSPVTIASTNIEEGPFYENENITATVVLNNTAATPQEYTLTLYEEGQQRNYHSIEDHYVSKTVTVEPGEHTFTLNGTWSYATQDATLQVNTQPRETFTVESPLVTDSISVDPATATVGESVTVTAEVRNAHGPEATYGTRFMKDGRYQTRTERTLAQGETANVTFTTSFMTDGTHTVSVGDNQTSMPVTTPVRATTLTVIDDPVYAHTNTTFEATVKNTENASGTFPVTVTDQRGQTVGRTSVSLNASESKTVQVNATLTDTFDQTVSVLNRTVTVAPENPFTITDTEVSDETIAVNGQTTLAVNVRNEHAPTGTYRLQFEFGDAHINKRVKLPANETTEATVTSGFTVGGDRKIRFFNEQIQTVTVTNPVNVTEIEPPSQTVYTKNAATFNATITHTGSQDGTYPVAVVSDHGHILTKETITIEAGATKTVPLEVTFQNAGSQAIRINNQTRSVNVTPAINLTDYSLSPTTPLVGETVTLTAELTNEHGPAGQYDYSVNAHPNYYNRKSVSLDPGETKAVEYTFSFETGGEHDVRIGETTQTVQVTNPINVTDYQFNTTTPSVGDDVAITVNATNTRDVQGSFPVVLTHEWRDTVYGQKHVDFASGESKTVRFNASFDIPKHYRLQLNNQTGVGVTVTSPLKVQNHSFSKNELYVDEPLTVTANVTNTGETGTYQLALTKWGRVLGSTNVTAEAGETKEVRFTLQIGDKITDRSQVALGNTAVDNLTVTHRITEQAVTVHDGVAPGEQAEVAVTYVNPTNKTGSTYVDTQLGDGYQSKSITLDPDETTTVTMTGTYDQPGRHYEHLNSDHVYVYVFNDTAGTANLTIPDQYFPREAVVNQEVYLPVQVVNHGDAAGVTDISLAVNGEHKATKRAYAEPDRKNYIWFRHTFSQKGNHTVSINNRTFTIDVLDDVVVNTSVTHVNGTAPIQQPQVVSRYSQYGVYAALTAPDGFPDLARVGADTTSTFRVNATLQNYTPNVLVNSGNDTQWSTTKLGPNKTRVSMLMTPSEMQFRSNPPAIENWTATNDSADQSLSAAARLRIGNGEYSRYDVNGSVLDGLTISTNAQRFRQPKYVPATGDTPPKLQVKVAGPHRAVDGDLNDGHYTAVIPDSLLDHWDVDDPAQLTVDYSADSGETQYTVEEVPGGLQITVQLHFSSGTVSIEKTTTSEDDTGSGGTGGSTTTTETTTEQTTATTTTATEPTTTTSATTTATTTTTESSPVTTTHTATTTSSGRTSFAGTPGFELGVTVFALVAALLFAKRRSV